MTPGKSRPNGQPRELHAGMITALAARGSRDRRVAVYLGGDLAFDLAEEVAGSAGLQRGDFLSEDRQTALLEDDQPYRARSLALAMLGSRERCCQEVAGRLRRDGFCEEIVSETLRWLRDLGYVDDRRFATEYARQRVRVGWGRQRIIAELQNKGVSSDLLGADVWEQLLDGVEQVDGTAAVVDLARRRFGRQFAEDPATAGRRLAGFLRRRGHDWETIARAVRELSEGDGD